MRSIAYVGASSRLLLIMILNQVLWPGRTYANKKMQVGWALETSLIGICMVAVNKLARCVAQKKDNL